MPTKTALLSSLQAVQDEILRLAGSMTESEQNTSGPVDQWGRRDILAHLGQNQRFLASDLAMARRSETPPPGDQPERSNDAVYQVYQDRPWSDIVQLLEESHQELLDQVRAFSDEELNDPNNLAWLNGTAVWRRVAGQSVIHATVHLAQDYIARGDRASGWRIAQLERDLGLSLDDSDRWLGMVYYNQGCYHALLGEKEKALQELEKGFRLAPQFVEFSDQDTDLTSLHGDPDFQEIKNRVKPVA